MSKTEDEEKTETEENEDEVEENEDEVEENEDENEENEDGDEDGDEDEEIEESVEESNQLKGEKNVEIDNGILHDLSYYVQKTVKNSEKESDKNFSEIGEIEFGSDSEDDEVVEQPKNGDTLRPQQMQFLQSSIKKSLAFHEHRLRMGKTVCIAPNKNFICVDCIADFKFLRCVDFGKNYLRDFRPFTELPFLGTLKLYKNGIREIASLKSKTLRFLDLFHNKLENLEGAYLPSVSRLKMNFNRLKSFDFLKGHEMKWLHRLELRGNKLKSTAGIRHSFLEELFLAENDIREIEDLEFCPNLKRLHLRDNQIIEVTGFSKRSAKLEYVNLRNNLITFVDDAIGISILPKIRTLIMLDNPVQLEKDFRMVMIARMPTLTVLDKELVESYDRDWNIMLLLDCLHHEKVNSKLAIDDLIDTLPPVEEVDATFDEEKSRDVDFDQKNDIEESLDGKSMWTDSASISDLDDDSNREYWGEETEGQEDEEEENDESGEETIQ